MLQKLFRFVFVLSIVVGAVYFLHGFISEKKISDPGFFHFCYIFNFGSTLLFTAPILLFGKMFIDQVGVAFLAQGMIKIGLFLFLAGKLNHEFGKENFLVFFVPYFACLLVELFFIFHMLKEKPNE